MKGWRVWGGGWGVGGGVGCVAERGGNNLNGFKDFCSAICSGQGHNLVLTGVFVPSSPESGICFLLVEVAQLAIKLIS